MNIAAKVLVVLVIALSALNCGANFYLFKKRTDWKTRYETDVNAANAQIESEKDTAARWHLWALNQTARADKLQSEIGQLKTAAEERLAAIKDKDKQLAAQERQIAETQELAKAAQANLNKQQDIAQSYKAESEKYSAQLLEAQKTIAEKSEQVASLQKNIDQLQEEKKELVQTNKKISQDLAKMENAWQEAQQLVTLPDVGEFPPPLDATVIDYRNDLNLVVLNVGREQGVKVNYKFTVYRADAYVGKVVVDMVDDGVCTARPVDGMQAEGQEIQVGDAATTRIQ
ncbi:MAG TPA: hypothetical protein PL033_01755 [Candidatus Brocadiia bacterium]|nr:hypothetical protein [Candidatus Brocadiia bacterium]